MAALKDKALEDYYSETGDLFRSKGWQFILEDLAKLEEPLLNIQQVSSIEDLRYKQGQIDVIRWLRNKAQANELAYEQLLLEESD